MNLALTEAWKYQFLTYPNPAVGAVVLGSHNEILSISAHEEAGFAHAEVLALRDAFVSLTADETVKKLKQSHEIHNYLKEHHNNLLSQATLYTTLAPCHHQGKTPSCSSLIEALGLKRVVIGSLDPHSQGGIEALKSKGIEVSTGIESQACDNLLSPFLAWKAAKPFSFFKVAQRLNGSVDGGIISNLTSRRHVHKLRSKIDTLIIGGNTIREDRPTLDTRLIDSGKNPDIAIYSHKKVFDKTIPLFNIAKREVLISDNKEELLQKAFVMIEGGAKAFESFKDDVDWILLYVSGTMAAGNAIQTDFEAEIMHIMPLEDNYLIWMKKTKG